MSEIHRGRFLPGDALPCYRTLAQELGVSRNTVMAAYRELADEGWLVARGWQLARAHRRPRVCSSSAAWCNVIASA